MTSLAVRLVRSSISSSETTIRQTFQQKHEGLEDELLSVSVEDVSEFTISGGGEAQVPHAVADQLGQLLPLGASVQVEALLGDALGVVPARVPAHPLPLAASLAEPPGPLHALLPQQGVIGLVVAASLVPLVLGVLAVVHTD